jgi:hypothetical protein
MTHEATVAQLTGNRTLSCVVAFKQACHVQVLYEMCPSWRRRRREKLRAEMDRRWLIAKMIRDSLAREAA